MNKIQEKILVLRNKITNKLWNRVYYPNLTKKKGRVLISYITEPFTVYPIGQVSNYHTMYWECFEIARLFSERGYECDIVNAQKRDFIPRKKYSVCIDTEDNFERYAKYLPDDCKKVFHILISHSDAYNAAEEKRLDNLEKRRGIRLLPRRKIPPSKDAEIADFLEGFGNKTVFATFARFNKPIFWIPISAVTKYDFPENKDWDSARKNFLWIGGGGAVLKGLDLVLEAFSQMPNMELHVCGPAQAEKDFVEEYKKELFETENIHFYGRIDVAGKQFGDIINKCGAVIYPSGGDGTSGAIIQAMHAGLIPIITGEVGVREDSGYIPISEPTPESVTKEMIKFSSLPVATIKDKSKEIWQFTRKTYTREEFSRHYARFIDEVLKI